MICWLGYPEMRFLLEDEDREIIFMLRRMSAILGFGRNTTGVLLFSSKINTSETLALSGG